MTRTFRNYGARSFSLVSLVGVFATLTLQQFSSGEEPKVDSPPATAPKCTWYQLVNVTIPEQSRHRHDDRLNAPPHLYIIIERDGEELGPASQVKRGWRIAFPSRPENEWPIWEGSTARYTIKLMDEQYGRDAQILEITDLKGEAFREVVVEIEDSPFDKDKLVRFKFEPVKMNKPAK